MRKWIPGIIVIAAAALSVWFYPRLPEEIPAHWNMAGVSDGYSSRRIAVLVMPLIMLGMYGLFFMIPLIDPRQRNFEKFSGAYELIISTIMLFMLALHAATLVNGAGRTVPMERFTPAALGVLLIIVGNVLPRARSNWFVGVRTPWTLSSEESWAKTHRLGGYLLVALGVALLVTVALLPSLTWPLLSFGGPVVALGLVVYSYFAWRSDPARNGLSTKSNA